MLGMWPSVANLFFLFQLLNSLDPQGKIITTVILSAVLLLLLFYFWWDKRRRPEYVVYRSD